MASEEDEVQAALMAKKAERAELRASERTYLQELNHLKPRVNSKFIAKEQRSDASDRGSAKPVQRSTSTAVSQIPLAPSAATAPRKRDGKRQPDNNKKTGKRFKFEWDESEDTLSGFVDPTYQLSDPKPGASDRLLRVADERAAKHASVAGGYLDPEVKPVDMMTERDWRILRENFDIRVRGGGASVPNPARNWQEMGMSKAMLENIHQIGYERPTAIQMQAIPIGLVASDMIGIAETGSGKTCAFVLPLLMRLRQEPWASQRKKCAEMGPLALILAPTRELVNQIEEDINTLDQLSPSPVRTVAVVGGNSAENQGFHLQEGCDVVIATPGRLIDLLSSRIAVLNHCSYIVLDEADRMIDMGFEAQVNKVLESLVVPLQSRTTFMFSATMPPKIVALAQRFMRASPIVIRIGDEESGKNKKIEQNVLLLHNEAAKEAQLDRLLARSEPPIIVFCNSKANCDQLVRYLKSRGQRAVALHSGRNQEEREGNLRNFKDGHHHILVATDVAGRGLDVEGVSHVINYDCPTLIDRYSHRIGRTGRAGKTGLATTLVVKGVDDPSVLQGIAEYLRETGQIVPKDLVSLLNEQAHIHE